MQGRRLAMLGAVTLGLLTIGCAGQLSPSPELRSAGNGTPTQGPADASHHVAVPFFPDDTDQCGPATLASVLTFWGVPADPQALKEEIYLPRLRGTLPVDLLLAAQARGLQAEIYRGSLDNLKSELKAGHPLVAFLNLGYALFPQGHYVVVTGYDDQRRGVFVHSGLERDVFLPYERFLHSWKKMGQWTLLVLPPVGRGKPGE